MDNKEIISESYLDGYVKAIKKVKDFRLGISTAEAFAFYCYCKHYNVDYIVESGTAFGKSASIWASCFPDKLVYTIDDNSMSNIVTPDKLKEVKKYLSKWELITSITGDSNKEIPTILDFNRGKIPGIFIDGPKGRDAIVLAETLMKQYPSIPFIAIDDFGENKSIDRQGLLNKSEFVYVDYVYNTYSTDKSFFKKYKNLDPSLFHGIAFFTPKGS